MLRKHWIVLALMVTGVYACHKETMDIFAGFQKPANFPEPVYHFTTNPVTKDGFELGRKLFYDPLLSRNNTISCGSCHIQTSAFTHHGHDVSHGIDDRLGSRNSPAIMNLAWNPALMWDGGIFDLDLQPIAPVTNHVEMDETMENVLTKLKNSSVYPALFQRAFGSDEITTAKALKALSQFMLMCVSSNSKYDKVKRNENETFTADEQAGYQLVTQKCSPCHKEPLFTDNSFRNNGIAIGANDDKGRYMVTVTAGDEYKFKVPSLRNVELTAPYMHDGRFYTLDAVLDHYSSHIQQTPNLDPLLSAGIPLSAAEKTQIIAFLKTLTDREFTSNRLLSEQ